MSQMEKTLRGVVRDHRVPGDYKAAVNQPAGTAAFKKQFWRWIRHRAITKQNITTPGYAMVSKAEYSFHSLACSACFHSSSQAGSSGTLAGPSILLRSLREMVSCSVTATTASR